MADDSTKGIVIKGPWKKVKRVDKSQTEKIAHDMAYIDDMAEACYACMENYSDSEIINIGTGYDISIKELTEVIAEVVNGRWLV